METSDLFRNPERKNPILKLMFFEKECFAGLKIENCFELFSNIKRYPLQTRRAMNSYYPIIRLGTSFMRQLTCQVSNSGNLKK